MACPYCKSEEIVSNSYYITKKFKLRNRWKCKNCERTFIALPSLRELTVDQHRKIIQLSRRINPYASKFDNRKVKTYSIREIAKILGISHTLVEKVLKNEN